jgi:hypothetical protein
MIISFSGRTLLHGDRWFKSVVFLSLWLLVPHIHIKHPHLLVLRQLIVILMSEIQYQYYHISRTIKHTFIPGKYCIKFSCILCSKSASIEPSKQLRFPHMLQGVSICKSELQMWIIFFSLNLPSKILACLMVQKIWWIIMTCVMLYSLSYWQYC